MVVELMHTEGGTDNRIALLNSPQITKFAVHLVAFFQLLPLLAEHIEFPPEYFG